MRPLLNENSLTPQAQTAIESFHSDFVQEVATAVAKHDWVIVGMAQNPFVGKARKFLSNKNIEFHYIERGGYLSKWKDRLAIKMWSGWPTFPQVFHKGKLVGGANDLERYLNK